MKNKNTNKNPSDSENRKSKPKCIYCNSDKTKKRGFRQTENRGKIQRHFFYLQSGCSQPEISPNNFKSYVLFPFPKGDIREEITAKSKEYYKEALKHQKEIANLQKNMIDVFDEEINKFL